MRIPRPALPLQVLPTPRAQSLGAAASGPGRECPSQGAGQGRGSVNGGNRNQLSDGSASERSLNYAGVQRLESGDETRLRVSAAAGGYCPPSRVREVEGLGS